MIDKPVVYIVDDDPMVGRALGRLLQAAGYDVLVCTTVVDFLRVFDLHVERPACIVLDQQMPLLDGLQIQALLRAAARLRPIIFLTGVGTIQMAVEALRSGAMDVLTKPVREDELCKAVESALCLDAEQSQRRRTRALLLHRLRMLTPRELEVMKHVLRGRLTKQIAADLGTVVKTIKVHRAHVMHKLGARNLPELIHLTNEIAAGDRAGGSDTDLRSSTAVAWARVRLQSASQPGIPPLRLTQWATWQWDIRSDRVFADAKLAKLFAVSVNEAQGGPLDAYLAGIHPDDAERVAGRIRTAIQQRTDYEATFRIRCRGNEQRVVVARGRVEYDESGRPVRMPGFVIEISDWNFATPTNAPP